MMKINEETQTKFEQLRDKALSPVATQEDLLALGKWLYSFEGREIGNSIWYKSIACWKITEDMFLMPFVDPWDCIRQCRLMPVKDVKVHTMCLCEGRHIMPEGVEGAIFPTSLNPLDTEGMEETAKSFLWSNHVQVLNLYVTGLSVALVAVINACNELDVDLTLYHYDRESGGYYPQKVS